MVFRTSCLFTMAFRCPPEVGLRNAIRLHTASSTSQASGQARYRAAVCKELGKPLQINHQDRQALEDNQVRVAVKRAAVNFADILTIQGKYQQRPELPFIPGYEISGEIVEIGRNVKRLKTGDRVVGISSRTGAYAEEIVTEDVQCQNIGNLSFEMGAAAISSYGTAEMALTRFARIKESESVLVTAAAGALGLAAVDLAANVFKANVIGACGGPEKCQFVSSYGAKFTIDYKKENLRERIKEITNGHGVDIVFDVVGGQVFDDSLRCLAHEGRILTLGYTSGQIPKIPANLLLVKNISAHGLYWGSYSVRDPERFFESVSNVLKWLQDGKLKPHVGKVFPLSQVNEAFEYLSSRKSTGKVLLDCTKV